MNNNIFLILKGAMMGIAEVIPGVSGGTIAFITGIYQRLLAAISSVDVSLIETFKSYGLKGVWNKVDGPFLFKLVLGMAIGIIIGVFVINYLLINYPQPLWGFFFGLILASSIYVGRQVDKWNYKIISAFIIGVVVAYLVTVISPTEGSLNPLYIILSGTLAISALMLPGLSGSFVLLLLGMYTIIIPNLKTLIKDQSIESLKIISLFSVGCIIGLALFSRVLTWLFKHYQFLTFALLSGFMIGSLNKVWPWRNIDSVLMKDSFEKIDISNFESLAAMSQGTYKVISESNVLPSNYWGENPMVLLTICTFLFGFAIVFIIEKMSGENMHPSNVN